MEKIVVTYHFVGNRNGTLILDIEEYDSVRTTYPDHYKQVLIDADSNPFGLRPTYISVDLYQDAEFVDVQPEKGTIEDVLGFSVQKLVGTQIRHIETI